MFRLLTVFVLVLGSAACATQALEPMTNEELIASRGSLTRFEKALVREREGARYLNRVHLDAREWPEWQSVRVSEGGFFLGEKAGSKEVAVILAPAHLPAVKFGAWRWTRRGEVTDAEAYIHLSTNGLQAPAACAGKRALFENISFGSKQSEESKARASSAAMRLISSIDVERLGASTPAIPHDEVFLDGSSISLFFSRDGDLYELYRGPNREDLTEGYPVVQDLVRVAAETFPQYAEYLLALDRDMQTNGSTVEARAVMRNFKISEDQCLA